MQITRPCRSADDGFAQERQKSTRQRAETEWRANDLSGANREIHLLISCRLLVCLFLTISRATAAVHVRARVLKTLNRDSMIGVCGIQSGKCEMKTVLSRWRRASLFIARETGKEIFSSNAFRLSDEENSQQLVIFLASTNEWPCECVIGDLYDLDFDSSSSPALSFIIFETILQQSKWDSAHDSSGIEFVSYSPLRSQHCAGEWGTYTLNNN